MKNFGAYLSNLRGNTKLSLDMLARLADCSKNTLSQLENNDKRPPFRGSMRKLIIVLAEVLCTSKNETRRYLELAEIDQSLLTNAEQIQIGFAPALPHSTSEDIPTLEQFEQIYQRLLTRIESKKALLNHNHQLVSLTLKTQEYTNALQEIQKRLDNFHNQQNGKTDLQPEAISQVATNNRDSVLPTASIAPPQQNSQLFLFTAEQQKLLTSLLEMNNSILTEDPDTSNLDISQRMLLRQFLALAGISVVPSSYGHQYTEPNNIAISEDVVTFFEQNMTTYWELYHTGGATRVIHGLDTWIKEIAKLAKLAQGTNWHKRTLTLLTMAYQLQSCVLRDAMQYDQAHKAYQKAFHIAQEIDDTELMSSALAREGVTLIQQEKPKQAIIYLDGALNLIEKQSYPKLKGHILQALSEANAKAQQPEECWTSIGLAEDMPEPLTQEHSLIRFNKSSIAAQKGVDAFLLGNYQDAIDIINKSLTTYDPAIIRGRARLIAQKAEAYYRLNAKEECIINAKEALILGQSAGSTKTIDRVRNLYTSLLQSPWREDQSIVQLGKMLSK